MKTKNVEELFVLVERLSLGMIRKKLLKFPKSEPCDSYELDSYKYVVDPGEIDQLILFIEKVLMPLKTRHTILLKYLIDTDVKVAFLFRLTFQTILYKVKTILKEFKLFLNAFGNSDLKLRKLKYLN